jgi:hypothetical protein
MLSNVARKMKVIKSVKQNYQPTNEVLSLLEQFRLMVNDSIRIGLRGNITSLKTLSLKAYHQISKYNVYSNYCLTAMSKAIGLLSNYRKSLKKNPNTKKPYVSKLMLTDCYGFRIKDGILRLTLKARNYIYIPLNMHTQTIISGHIIRSVTLTPYTLSISYAKETEIIKPTGLIGIDRNLDNVTIASNDGNVKQYDLSKATRIKSIYRTVTSHFKRNDIRLRKQVFSKYGIKQKNRVNQILHNISKEIVQQAKIHIIMEL